MTPPHARPLELHPQLTAALAGRYEIEREIGSGAMAIVYLAKDLKHNRHVALKVLRAEIASTVVVQRFFSEIEIVGRLQHPNIVQLYDSGTIEGTLYYVVPFADGQSLRDLLQREGQLPLDIVLQVSRDIAHALAYAHAHGVIHRDVKPENVLFFGGVAAVSDFGLARALVVASGDQISSDGTIVGTPLYMSPEQAAGDVVDTRSDIYSFACVVYEMLAAEPPFAGTSAQAIRSRHLRDPVPSLRTLRGTVSVPVQETLERALAKSPGDRYQTISGFMDALTAAANAKPPAPHRMRWRIAGSLVVVALVMLAAWLRFGTARADAPHAPRLIVLPFAHQGDQADRFIAEGLTEELTSRVAVFSGLSVIATASATHFDQASRLRDVAREMQVDYVVTGSVRTERKPDGKTQLRVIPHLVRGRDEREIWSGVYDANFTPGELLLLQSGIAVKVASALGISLQLPEQADLQSQPTADPNAYASFVQGNVYASRRYDERSGRLAIAMYQSAVKSDPKFALAFAKLAEAQTMYYYFADRDPARLEKAREAIRRAMALDSSLPEAQVATGYLHWWGNLDADAALAALSSVRARQPNNAALLWIIGSVLRRKGRLSEAAQTFERAIELDPRSHLILADLAACYTYMRRYEDADRLFDRAMALAPDWPVPVVFKSVNHWAWFGDPTRALAVVQAERAHVSMSEMLKLMYRYPDYPAQVGGEVRDSLIALTTALPGVDAAKLYLGKAYAFRFRGDSAWTRIYFDSARAVLEQRARRSLEPETRGLLGIAYAGLGRAADARREGDLAIRLVPLSKDAVFGVMMLSHRLDIAVFNGDDDDALRVFGTLLRVPSQWSKAMLRLDPFFERLRGHPRWVQLTSGPEIRY